jgi:hypothetical protein
MNFIKVIKNSYTEVTKEADPDDELDQDSTFATTVFHGIKLVGKNDYADIPISFDLEEGKDYFLVVASYTGGDSFSEDEGIIEIIDLYKDQEKAKETFKILLDHYEQYDEDTCYSVSPVNLTREDGEVYPFCPPWCGHFERLEEISIVTLKLI